MATAKTRPKESPRGSEFGALRRVRRVRSADVAKRLGIHHNTLTDVERDKVRLDPATMAQWEQALDDMARERWEVNGVGNHS